MKNQDNCVTVALVDEEVSKKIDRILALAEENNAYIRKVRSVQKTSQMMKAIYWVIIGVFVLGGFYFVQPYLNTLMSLYSGTTGKSASSFSIPDASQLQELVKQLKQ